MNKKPMSSIRIKVNLFLIFVCMLFEIVLFFDADMPNDVKVICSCIFLPVIMICLIILGIDFILRKKYIKNQIFPIKEDEEIINVSEWNKNESIINFPDERTIYDEDIMRLLGENRTFIRRTDEYGNVVLENINDNIVDWFLVFLLGIAMSIIMMASFFYNKINIFVTLISLLFLMVIIFYSIFQITRIKKLRLKIRVPHILKFLFMFGLIMLMFSVFLMMAIDFKFIEIYFGEMFLFLLVGLMVVGFFSFIYAMFLILKNK